MWFYLLYNCTLYSHWLFHTTIKNVPVLCFFQNTNSTSLRTLVQKCYNYLTQHSLKPTPAQPKVPSQPRVLDWLNSNPLSRSCAQPGKVWTLLYLFYFFAWLWNNLVAIVCLFCFYVMPDFWIIWLQLFILLYICSCRLLLHCYGIDFDTLVYTHSSYSAIAFLSHPW